MSLAATLLVAPLHEPHDNNFEVGIVYTTFLRFRNFERTYGRADKNVSFISISS